MPTPRERVLMTLRHEHPGKCPRECGFTPAAYERFQAATGAVDPAEHFDFECRGIGPGRVSPQADFSVYYGECELASTTEIDDWGTARTPGDYYHFWKLAYPMKHLESVGQLEEYPWPTYSYEDDVERTVAGIHERGYAVSGWTGHIWETAWQLRGMDNLMFDFLENPDFAAFILDRIADEVARCAEQAARAGCDVIRFGDDVGMQDRLMMSEPMWREWLFPRLARAIGAARAVNPSVHVWYHSDGDIRGLIPGLMEAGVDVLNPVQPECMDPREIRAEYGKQLAFWGCVGTQTTFPFGTPEEMKRVVGDLIEGVGASGGLVLAPTHVLEPDVPWENVAAFFEAIDEAAEG